MSSEEGEREVKCPRDGNSLTVIYESEKIGDLVKVSIYYKCSACGYRKDLERLEVKRGDQGTVIKKFLFPYGP
ncbi:MAG: hypothetical protein QXW94_01060 [Desulfurococcaceae archaeon]